MWKLVKGSMHSRKSLKLSSQWTFKKKKQLWTWLIWCFRIQWWTRICWVAFIKHNKVPHKSSCSVEVRLPKQPPASPHAWIEMKEKVKEFQAGYEESTACGGTGQGVASVLNTGNISSPGWWVRRSETSQRCVKTLVGSICPLRWA